MHRSAATLGLALAANGFASVALGQTFEVRGLHVAKGGIEIDLDNAVFSGGAGDGAGTNKSSAMV